MLLYKKNKNERKKAISITFHANALNIDKTTYFIINSSTKEHYIGRPDVIGGAEFYKIGQMRTKRRGYTFHFVEIFHTSWKFSLYFVHIFRKDSNFFTKLCSSDLSFNWTMLTLLYLKFETSVHARILVIRYYILFTSTLTWYEFETYIGETFLINKVGQQWFFQLDFFLKMYSGLSISHCPFAKFVTSKSPLYDLLKCWHFY